MSLETIKILQRTHGVIVLTPYFNQCELLRKFCSRFAVTDRVWDHRLKKKVVKTVAMRVLYDRANKFFAFPIAILKELTDFIEFEGNVSYEIVQDREVESTNIEFNLPGIEPNSDTQVKALEFLSKTDKNNLFVLPLPTGQGKTLTTFMDLEKWSRRTCFFMAPTHFGTWVKTLKQFSDLEIERDVLLVNGKMELRKLIEMGLRNVLNAKFILISSPTFDGFIKDFLHMKNRMELPEEFWEITPKDFMQTIRCDTLVVDECHELWEQTLRRTPFLNVNKAIYLSATIGSKDPITDKVHSLLFPDVRRFKDFEQNQHAIVVPVYWTLDDSDSYKYQGTRGYHHGEFEKSIMLNHTYDYFEVLYEILLMDFVKNYKEGLRLLVLFSMRTTTTLFAEFLRTKPFFKDLRVDRLIGGDDKEDIVENADVIISTIKSCGTGTDIVNLDMCLLTVAVATDNLMDQIAGRTRKIKRYKDRDPRFYYMVCRTISKHLAYDFNHRRNLGLKSLTVSKMELSKSF